MRELKAVEGVPGSGTQYHSQSDEDGVIVEFFKGLDEPGRFLDIGAHDGVHFSNVRKLYEAGWSGVMVEVAPGPLRSAMATYRNAPQVTLVQAAITAVNRTWLDFAMNDDFTSTSVAAHEEKWAQATPYQHVWATAVPWSDLLMQFPGPYNMVNLDIEGGNWAVFEQIMLTDVEGMKLICVEFDDKREMMLGAAAVRGFELLHSTSENLILVR